HLVIKEVSLVNPEVVWAQNADGKWRVPSTPPEPVVSAPRTSTAASPTVAPPAEQNVAVSAEPAQPSPPIATQTESDNKGAGFTPEVERVNVIHARFRFLDEKLKS